MARRISKSYLCAVKCMYALVKFLDEENRECSRPEIFEHMQRHVNFTYWESEHMGSTIRWQLITRNMAYHYQRAGLLTRREEVYRITPKGREALELGAEAMQREVDATIPTWASLRGTTKVKKMRSFSEERIFFYGFLNTNYHEFTWIIILKKLI